MNWFTKHADTAVVLSAVIGAMLWMNSSVSELRIYMHDEISIVKADMAQLKTDIAVIKTVLVMKQILPCELAEKGEGK